MKRIYAVGSILALAAALYVFNFYNIKSLVPESCPAYYRKSFQRFAGKVQGDKDLRFTYLFHLNFGSPSDLDFIATDIGKNPRLRYIQYLGNGEFAEDKTFPHIPTEHARDLVAFQYLGKKAFAITDHGIDKMPFTGGSPRFVVQESSGWMDQSQTLFPPLRSFNFTLATLHSANKKTPDLFLATVAQAENGNSVLFESDSKGVFKISKRLPKEFASPDFCYMMVRNLNFVAKSNYLFLGACDRPRDAVLNARDRILKVSDSEVSLLPPDNLPPRKKDATWGTVSGQVADLNNDGYPDIVAVVHNHGFTQGGIQLYLGTSDPGKFRSPAHDYYEIGRPEDSSFVPFVKVADLDGDKLPELLIPHVAIMQDGKAPENIQKFGLFKNINGEDFQELSGCLGTSLDSVMNVELLDFDQNGKNDILLMDYHGNYEIYFNK